MNSIKLARANLRGKLTFKSPIFEWSSFASAWTQGVYHKLLPILRIEPSDFESAGSVNFAEQSVTYRIYGGQHSITIHPNRLEIDLPELIAADDALVNQIFCVIHDLLVGTKVIELEALEVINGYHFHCIDFEVDDFLNRFRVAGLSEALEKSDIKCKPAIKFGFTAPTNEWSGTVVVERSVMRLLEPGLFMSFVMNVRPINHWSTFQEKSDLVNGTLFGMLAALGLKLDA